MAKKVMVVDDAPDMVNLIADMLKFLGHEIIPAYSGEEALKKLADNRPDLVLLDIMMPGMDGIEVCQRIKENPETRDIPVVMVTARLDKQAYMDSMHSGANGYMTKPFVPDDLLKSVGKFLE